MSGMSLSDFLIQTKFTEKQIEQLVEYSQKDELVRKFSSDGTRFASRAAFDEWLAKGRTPYVLSDAEGNLCGLSWFVLKPLPKRTFLSFVKEGDYTATFGIRLYGNARGKGLAFPFMVEAHKRFFKQVGKKGVWLEVFSNNVPAVSAYTRFGYVPVTKADEAGKMVMALSL